MFIKKVKTTKHKYSYKQNITWQLLIIIQFMIVMKQVPLRFGGGKVMKKSSKN